jgi:hypothetical protein
MYEEMKMNRLRSLVFAAGLLCSGFASSVVHAGVLMDDVNGTATPGFFVFGPGLTQIGWVYTPATPYNLDRIETTFRAVPNGSAFTRLVTLSLWDELPGSGGVTHHRCLR